MNQQLLENITKRTKHWQQNLFQLFYIAIKPNNILNHALPTHSQFVDGPIDEPWEQ